MAEVSVMCCYNNAQMYKEFENQLKQQDIDVDIIGIDNSNNKYKSCAKAFNDNLDKVKTEFVIFSHQDIRFIENKSIKRFLEFLKKTCLYGIVGVAGQSNDGHQCSNVYHGTKLIFTGDKRIDGYEECDTVDECFFGGYTKCFKDYPFNESLCEGWHLYAVERCLNARKNNHKVYACGINLIHLSQGKLNDSYYKCLRKICDYYKEDFHYINTTCIQISTRYLNREFKILKEKIAWMPVIRKFVFKHATEKSMKMGMYE